MHVVVLGAGLAGLAAAYELSRAGVRVTVLEQEPFTGGMAHSWRVGPYWLDHGPHRFWSRDEELVQHVTGVLDGDVVVRDRRSRIHLFGRWFDYPLRASNVVRNLPPRVLARALFDYGAARVRERIAPTPDADFESWVVKRFGRTLYETFFGTYTQKTWGMPCDRISSDWASQRISQADLWDTIKKTLCPPRDNGVRSLASEFLYPRKGGIGEIGRKYALKSRAAGATIRLDARVEHLESDGDRIRAVVFESLGERERIACDEVVATIPLQSTLRALGDRVGPQVRTASDRLEHVAIVFVYLEIDAPSVSKDHWIYLPEKHLRIHRVSEPKNFSDLSAPGGTTALCCEITCRRGDATWNLGLEEAAAIAERDLVACGLIAPGTARPLDIAKLAHAYPVYDLDYKARFQTLRAAAKQFTNLQTTGRQGLFRYNNMDHSIAMGRKAARTLIERADAGAEQVALAPEWFG
jgi:protoporphyrinogen oxidase